MSKERLDVIVVQRGLAESREKAQALIGAGQVRSKDQVLSKSGHKYDSEIPIEVKQRAPFVSRGGEKLEGAFKEFDLNVEGLVCLDVGSSTGGFTDCMLKHGASKVYAVDVGKGQLHWNLRNDDRVVVMEEVNARYLVPEDLDGIPQFATMDVSFISLTKVLPAVIEIIAPTAKLVTLIKPQFEAGRSEVGKGGVVRDEKVREEVVNRIKTFGTEKLGMKWLGVKVSPLKGPKGNVEYLAYWEK